MAEHYMPIWEYVKRAFGCDCSTRPRRSFWGVSFTNAAAPRGAEGRLALELQFKVARSTVDIDLAMFRPVANNSRDRSLSSNSRVTVGSRQPAIGGLA